MSRGQRWMLLVTVIVGYPLSGYVLRAGQHQERLLAPPVASLALYWWVSASIGLMTGIFVASGLQLLVGRFANPPAILPPPGRVLSMISRCLPYDLRGEFFPLLDRLNVDYAESVQSGSLFEAELRRLGYTVQFFARLGALAFLRFVLRR